MANTDMLTVQESELTESQKEAFEAAFLEKDATVEWQGKSYRIIMMDQDYPEENGEEITVSFTLEKILE